MSLYCLTALIFVMGAACGFYLGCKVSDLKDGIGEADDDWTKPGGTD